MSKRYNAPTGVRNVFAAGLLLSTMLTAIIGGEARTEFVHVDADRQQERAAQLIGNVALEQYWQDQTAKDLAEANGTLDLAEKFIWVTVGLGAATGVAESVVDERLKYGQ